METSVAPMSRHVASGRVRRISRTAGAVVATLASFGLDWAKVTYDFLAYPVVMPGRLFREEAVESGAYDPAGRLVYTYAMSLLAFSILLLFDANLAAGAAVIWGAGASTFYLVLSLLSAIGQKVRTSFMNRYHQYLPKE